MEGCAVRFLCNSGLEGVFPHPVPAKKAAPHFYKVIPPQSSEVPSSSTVKRCVPFMEAMTAGFIIPMWSDMHVLAKGGEMTVNFPSNFPLPQSLGHHGYEQMPNHPLADRAYGRILMKLINPWIVETAAGWSCLFTSPMNHLEHRLKILDGIVDTDTYYNNVNFPFVWTGGDGSFMIRKGTPIVQVFPFKRAAHSMEVGPISEERRSEVSNKLGTVLNGGYRGMFWSGAKTRSEQPDNGGEDAEDQ